MPYFACPMPTVQQQRQQRPANALDPYLEAILSQISGYEDPRSSGQKPTSAAPKSTPRPTPTPCQHNRSNRAFSPRFDVYETADAYHLDGDLPGVSDKAAIGIEFSDENTMSVSGRVDRLRLPVEKHEEKHEEEEKEESTSMERRRSLQPTVEDTDDEDDFSIVSGSSTKKPEQALKPEEAVKSAEPERKTWVGERTFGNFQRTFSFPSPVELEKVSAKLEAGLLQIVVPKRVFGGVRKIEIV